MILFVVQGKLDDDLVFVVQGKLDDDLVCCTG